MSKNISAGYHSIVAHVETIGNSNANLTYRRDLQINGNAPSQGSFGGGLPVTIVADEFHVKIIDNNERRTSLSLSPLSTFRNANPTKVPVEGISCRIRSINTTAIVCWTGSNSRTDLAASVRVLIEDRGYAIGTVTYQDMHLWSSLWTWAGRSPLEAATIVLIESDTTIFLDISTPILKALLIDNATLIFDDRQDIHLPLEYRLIINGGRLQIGTASQPFQHRATITLYGDLRSIEIPIRKRNRFRFIRIGFGRFFSHGAKVLAIRQGILDMHGQSTVKSWTRLGLTAANDSSTITLIDPIDWPVNSDIVIATTGDRLSQQECEKRRMMNISSDGRQLTLNEPLRYTHLGLSQSFNGTTIEIRAEVGLPSHTIRIEGTRTLTVDDLPISSALHSSCQFNRHQFEYRAMSEWLDGRSVSRGSPSTTS